MSCGKLDEDDKLPNFCNYTMPFNITLSAARDVGSTRWNASTYLDPTMDNSTVVAFEALQLNSTRNLLTARAWQCSIKWCAQTYGKIEVRNGIVSIPSSTPTELILLPNLTQIDSTTASQFPRLRNSGKLLIPKFKDSIYDNNKSFSVGPYDFANVKAYSEELFRTGWSEKGNFTTLTNISRTAPFVGSALGTTDNVPAAISRLAQSMTEAVRTGSYSIPHTGDAYIWKSYIYVRWAWLALPLGLVVLSLILLLVTIRSTRSSRIGFWKSSAVAALLHRLEGWPDEDLQVSSPEELFRKSRTWRGRVFEQNGKLLIARDVDAHK